MAKASNIKTGNTNAGDIGAETKAASPARVAAFRTGLSAEARARIAAAQKKRWAKAKSDCERKKCGQKHYPPIGQEPEP